MGALMTSLMIVSGINVLLLLPILVIHGKGLKDTRTTFSLGLFLFAGLLLLQNAFFLYYLITMMPLFAAGLEPFVLSYSVLQLFALLILNWVSFR